MVEYTCEDCGHVGEIQDMVIFGDDESCSPFSKLTTLCRPCFKKRKGGVSDGEMS